MAKISFGHMGFHHADINIRVATNPQMTAIAILEKASEALLDEIAKRKQETESAS